MVKDWGGLWRVLGLSPNVNNKRNGKYFTNKKNMHLVFSFGYIIDFCKDQSVRCLEKVITGVIWLLVCNSLGG